MTININRIIQETSRVQPHLIAGFHGERIRLEVSYRNYGATVSIAGAAVTFYWRTDADEPGHWHEAAGSVVDGAAVAEWGPTMDAGPDNVQWFLRVDADGDTSFRAAGALRLLPSPGFDPAVLPPATVTLDFATIEVLNEPYWTKTEADARFASVAGGTMTGPLTAPNFYATDDENAFVIAPEGLTGGVYTTFEHPGVITVTEQEGANPIFVFVPGTVAAASNPAKTLALRSDIPAVSAETWTFEVDDGQGGTETVTKSVAVYAQAAQGGA